MAATMIRVFQRRDEPKQQAGIDGKTSYAKVAIEMAVSQGIIATGKLE